ncbi:MAG: type I methionyl aminopeptidase [Desulfobacterales bacterium]|jgi:methionyl aminopeptidase|nr:type I methionyl aminopeptidase [Desulfobacterales bacterium]MCK5486724.1 type I methionyl aminopeptidase [Desulfobacterales bacterium]NOQ18592.1 type I methionyl aminopeptidase [Desulfobacterales bacterium]
MISKAKLNLLKEKGNTVKVGRNDPCPCGSGLKYKRCCLGKEVQDNKDPGASYARRYKIQLKENVDISGIRKAGRLVLDTLDLVEPKIRPGMMTDDINTIVHEFTVKNGAQPAPLNYRGFPKSVCVSVNEEVCHGIPGKRVIADGDIVNVDVTSVLNGYYADANKTFFAGTPGPEARKIVSVAKECLNRGISMVKPGNTIGDIGWAIQSYAEEQGCSVVRDFVGHGVGFEFHESPQVPHFGQKGQGVRLIPGMVFTIEPMINLGSHELKILEDNWTAVTKDRSLSAQFEQTLLVTDSGFESLTPYDL